ncbi:hypothetical protein ES708_10101 [subsurface metagenome]
MYCESNQSFYEKEITNILYSFLNLCKNIEDKKYVLKDNQITVRKLLTYNKQQYNFELDFTKLYFLLREIKNSFLTERFHGYFTNPERFIFKDEKLNILNSSGVDFLNFLREEKEKFLPNDIENLIIKPLFGIKIERDNPHKQEIQELLENKILINRERLLFFILNNLNWLLDPVHKKEIKEYVIIKKSQMHYREYNNIVKEICKHLLNSEIIKDNEGIQNLFELYLESRYDGPMVYNIKFRTNESIRVISDHLSKSFNTVLRVDLPENLGYLGSHPKIFTSRCMIEYGFECKVYYIENDPSLRNNLYFKFYFLEKKFPNSWDDLSERIKLGLNNIISEMRKQFQLYLIEIIDIPEEISATFRKDLYVDEKMLTKGVIKSFSKSDLKTKLESKLNENEFREDILKPILTDLGYEDIRILHGRDELGKDIIFKEFNRFGLAEWSGAVVKVGDIHGDTSKPANYIEIIVNQVKMCKKTPYQHLNEREIFITKVFVITSGNFIGNAKQSLRFLIRDPLIEGSVFFIDRDYLLNLNFEQD